MKPSKSITRTKIEELLDAWNKNCESNGLDEQFKLEYRKLNETFTIAGSGDMPDREGTVIVGRVTLSLLKVIKDDKGVSDIQGITLYKYDFPLNSKQNLHQDSFWQEQVSKQLLYEMVGTFCMTARGIAMKKIEIQERKDLTDAIQHKIAFEENAILNKPEAEKTEEDKVFGLIDKSKKVKVQKTGIVDKYGADFVSETIE